MSTATHNGTFAKAFLAAQRELKTITKDAKNPHFKNTYASLDTIIEDTRPVLNKYGIAVIQGATTPDRDEAGRVTAFTVETTLLHESGESMTRSVIVPLAKSDAQGAGGALTYGRRYGLSAILCLATDEDDDGNRAGVALPRDTSSPKPAASRAGNPADKPMPFGKTKGKKLGDHTDQELSKTLDWCREKDADKFADLIAALEDVLDSRRDQLHPALDAAAAGKETDDLPF